MASKTSTRAEFITLLNDVGGTFKFCSKKLKVLSAIAWKPEVATEFFKSGESKLPAPTYQIDRKSITECLELLKKMSPKLKSEHPVHQWLKRMQDSFIQGATMLLELETPQFYEIASELYGNAQTNLFAGQLSNLSLANAIEERLSVCSLSDISEGPKKTSEVFASDLERKLEKLRPEFGLRVEVTDQIVAKVVAGMNRVRIRKGAHFSHGDLETLWNHEIESHCLTAHNGALQEHCGFLNAGGPRTTMTQEGLAVFFEVYGHTMTQKRFLAICHRIQAVDKVATGANFIDLYRWYLERSDSPLESFYNTQRIFRGAKITGGAPFPKDTVYLGGLIGVYNFLRIAVKNQNRLLVESLIAGRMGLEDIGAIAWLRTHGIADPPRFVPDWIRRWESLLSFFSLSAILGTTDLAHLQSYFDSYYSIEEWDLTP